MRELAALVLAVVAIASYFVAATRFGLYQRWPLVHFALLLAAAAVVIPALAHRHGWRKAFPAVTLALVLGLTGLFAWYTLGFSTYASTKSGVAVGDELGAELAGFELASHTGQPLPVVRPGVDRATLLVFYRGHW